MPQRRTLEGAWCATGLGLLHCVGLDTSFCLGLVRVKLQYEVLRYSGMRFASSSWALAEFVVGGLTHGNLGMEAGDSRLHSFCGGGPGMQVASQGIQRLPGSGLHVTSRCGQAEDCCVAVLCDLQRFLHSTGEHRVHAETAKRCMTAGDIAPHEVLGGGWAGEYGIWCSGGSCYMDLGCI